MRRRRIDAGPDAAQAITIFERARVGRALDALALFHEHVGFDDAHLDAILEAIESRALPRTLSGEIVGRDRLDPAQLARARSLAAGAIRARGGSYRLGGVTWRSDGSMIWAELAPADGRWPMAGRCPMNDRPGRAIDPPPIGPYREREQARISHDLDVIALQIHGGVLDDARLDELVLALGRRTWPVPAGAAEYDRVRIGGDQYARLKLLLADAIHRRGGSYRTGGVTWRSDGARAWAEP